MNACLQFIASHFVFLFHPTIYDFDGLFRNLLHKSTGIRAEAKAAAIK